MSSPEAPESILRDDVLGEPCQKQARRGIYRLHCNLQFAIHSQVPIHGLYREIDQELGAHRSAGDFCC